MLRRRSVLQIAGNSGVRTTRFVAACRVMTFTCSSSRLVGRSTIV